MGLYTRHCGVVKPCRGTDSIVEGVPSPAKPLIETARNIVVTQAQRRQLTTGSRIYADWDIDALTNTMAEVLVAESFPPRIVPTV